MAVSWLTVDNDQIINQSNHPSQKSIDILPEDCGSFPAGTIFICYTDESETLGAMRRFYYKEPEDATFTLFTDWSVIDQAVGYNKNTTTSFRIAKNSRTGDWYLYAITKSFHVDGSYNQFHRIYLGVLNLRTEVTFNSYLVFNPVAETPFDYGDIDVSPDGNYLFLCWTVTGYVFHCYYDILAGTFSLVNTIPLLNGGSYPKVSVLWRSGNDVWVHVNGGISGVNTGYSTLFSGRFNDSNLLINGYVCDIDIRDAQMCKDDYGGVAFFGCDNNVPPAGAVFRSYDPVTGLPSDIEQVQNMTAFVSLRLAHGICYRDGYYHVLFYNDDTDALRYYTKPHGATTWTNQTASEPANIATNYFCCQNVQNPVCIDSAYFGFVCIEYDGTTPFNLYYRASGDLFSTAVITYGNYYTDGILDRCVNIEVGFKTGSIALRGDNVFDPASTVFAPSGFLTLSDGVQLTIGDRAIGYFNDTVFTYGGALGESEIKYDDFSGISGLLRVVSIRLVFDGDNTYTVQFYNKANESQTISVNQALSDQEIEVNFYGEKVGFSIKNSDGIQINLQQIELVVEKVHNA